MVIGNGLWVEASEFSDLLPITSYPLTITHYPLPISTIYPNSIIQVNARTLATDNDFRNRAIKNQVLETDSYEFISFTPTALNGLPDQISVGETYTIETVGDLTIKDVTRDVIIITLVTVISETQL